jgi:hypothetical protein
VNIRRYPNEVNMGFHEPHTLLLILLSALIGLGSYGLIIRFFCGFLAVGRQADDRQWSPAEGLKPLLPKRSPDL